MPKRKSNIKINHGEWLEIDISTAGYPDAVMYIDRADWDRLRARGIRSVFMSKMGYPVFNHSNRVHLVHRFVMDSPKVIDHINQVKYDARRKNLRVCTHSENHRNGKVRPNNKLGVLGVCPDSRDPARFRAYIMVDGRQVFLGRFDEFNDAVTARRAAELEYFGEFAPNESS